MQLPISYPIPPFCSLVELAVPMEIVRNMDIDEALLKEPNNLSKHNKRWHSAFLTIYCSRAFLLPSTEHHDTEPMKKTANLKPSSSFTIVDLSHEHSFRIDQKILTHIVKEKDLQEHDGVDGIASVLQANIEDGILGDETDIARRQEAFGSNTYPKPPSKSFLHFTVKSFKDLTILILMVCAALSLGFGIKEHGLKEGWYDGGSIFVAVFTVIAVSSIGNYRQNRQFDELSQVSNNIQIDVLRNRRRQQISIFEIVVGDVVLLKIGDQVPADGLFLEGHSLQVDESSMTGESDHVDVNKNSHPFLYSGTKVVDGYAKMLVTSVGMNTTWGQMMISSTSRDTNEQTPLQARLNKLTSSIGKVGLTVAFLVLLVLLIRYFTGNTKDENGNQEFNGSKRSFDDIFNAIVGIVADAVAIVVVAIPEGLPLAVTLTLAYSMKKMMADQAMVRKLSTCETMGSATTICTDKTGILTFNQMKVTKFWLGQGHLEGSAYLSVAPCVLRLIREGIALNTTCSVYKPKPDSAFEFSGSPTEKAILSWAVMDIKMEMEKITQNCSIIHVEAFNSEKKRMGVMIRRKADNTSHVHWKGAAEIVLKMCSSYYDASGIVKDLDDGVMSKFEHIIQKMAASGLRCIAFATKQVTEEQLPDEEGNKTLRDGGLILLAITGITNPCREGVKAAVEACQNAGVSIKMITGDNIFTAKYIASECGILEPNDQDTYNGTVVEAEEFRNCTEEERLEKIDKIRVMARSTPSDKLLMIQCLKQKHRVIFVSTGNDTHDAAALKEADVGISVGKNATREAKESSDIFIGADNGFVTAVMILMLLRLVQDNIHKLIVVQLTTNVVALVLNSLIMVIPRHEVPITVLGYFGACLIIYVAYFLSFAVNVAGKDVKELIENPPAESINRNVIWRKVLTGAFYLIAPLLILRYGFGKSSLFYAESKDCPATLIFISFMLHRVYNEFHAKCHKSAL